MEKAASDWRHRFEIFPHFDGINKSAALEIGFGGGRLLTQAAKRFENVYGVDIHKNFAMTKKFLTVQGLDNAQLVRKHGCHA